MTTIDRITASLNRDGIIVLEDTDYNAMVAEICRLRQVERQLAEQEEHY